MSNLGIILNGKEPQRCFQYPIIGGVRWVYYAYMRSDVPVMLANGVTGLLNLVILAMKSTLKRQLVIIINTYEDGDELTVAEKIL